MNKSIYILLFCPARNYGKKQWFISFWSAKSESLRSSLMPPTLTKQEVRMKRCTRYSTKATQYTPALLRSTNDLWIHSKFWHANKASWTIFSASKFSTFITAWKKSLESRPGFHSAKLGHKHIHNLSGISSSITKKHSLFCVKLGSHEACKKNKVSGFKNSQNKKLHNHQSYLSINTQRTDAEFESTDKRRKIFFFSLHYNR